MAQVHFSATPAGIKETCSKLFPKHKEEGDKSPLRILEHDYNKLGDNEYVQWLALDKEANELAEKARLLREKRDQIWESKLKTPVMDAKKIITGVSIKTPTYTAGWGFQSVKSPTKREKTVEEIAATAAKDTAKANAKVAAKAAKAAAKTAKGNADAPAD